MPVKPTRRLHSGTSSPAMNSGPTRVLSISDFHSTLAVSSPSSPAPQSFALPQTNGMAQSPKQHHTLQQQEPHHHNHHHHHHQPQQQRQTPDPDQPANGPTASSSSKVIQRLTSDNDRLRRELRAERAAKEEAQEELRAQKNLFAALQSQTSNLEHIHGNDRLLTERKDRRIAQLRDSLALEASRRAQAEDKAKEACDRLDDVHSTAQRDVADAQLAARRADAAYETLRGSHAALRADLARLRADVHAVHDANSDVNRRIERVSLVSDERDRHQAAAHHVNGQLRRRLDEYRARDERVAALEAELEDAVRAMRWVVRLHGPAAEEQGSPAKEPTQESPTRPTRQPPPRPH